MSRHIHLNLINEDEIRSSSPVRARVIAPVVVAVLSLATLSWWFYLYTNHTALKRINARHFEINRQLQPGYTRVLDLTAREKKLEALIAQLKAFRNARIRYGELFGHIPSLVAPNIQFTKLEVLPPPAPLFEKDKEAAGPTNTTERAGFLITGRTTGVNAVESVEHLLNALKSGVCTNFVQAAEIPLNAIRPENPSRREEQAFLRFDIHCECRPRRFE